MITLPSGLQYKVLRSGDGDSHPTADSSCECHYEGRTAQSYAEDPEGKSNKFDSSYDRGSPTSFAPNQVIGGWTEAMQLMVEGDKWEMYIPSELGYGDRGSPPKIGGGDVLVFTMEIIKIKGNKVPASRCDVKTLEKCSEQESKYITSKKSLDKAAIDAEVARLEARRRRLHPPCRLPCRLRLPCRRRLPCRLRLPCRHRLPCRLRLPWPALACPALHTAASHCRPSQASPAAPLRWQGMKSKKMAPKQAGWLSKRVALLGKMKDEL